MSDIELSAFELAVLRARSDSYGVICEKLKPFLNLHVTNAQDFDRIAQELACYAFLMKRAKHPDIGATHKGVVLHYEGRDYAEINMPAALPSFALSYSIMQDIREETPK